MLGRIVRSQRGAYMVFFAILVPFFLGMIGFAVDAGFLYMQKAKMQDIADAAALAGAARLNDGSDMREGNVTSAVKAYAAANGMKTNATNLFYLDNEASLSPSKDTFQIAHGILTGVTDKDNVQRDHVRVVIAKRVPTFFINLLFPEEKDGVLVKAAAEAEYVEGEEVASYSGPRIYCGQYSSWTIRDKNTIVVNKGQNFSIYTTGSGIARDRLPEGSVGTIYEGSQDHAGLPDGWTLVSTTLNMDANPTEAQKKEYEAAKAMEAQYERLLNEKKSEGETKLSSDLELYKQGASSGTNKRYIGPGPDGKIMNNITEDDREIELLMMGTDVKSMSGISTRNFVIFDKEIKNVNRISTLIVKRAPNVTDWTMLNIDTTKKVTYGNIYALGDAGIYIAGAHNYFEGMIYGTAEVYIGGNDNHFITDLQGTKGAGILCGRQSTLSIGITKKPNWGNQDYHDQETNTVFPVYTITEFTDTYESNNSNWHMYWGDGSSSGSGSSGSSGSDTETKAHVRLVK